MITLQVCLLEYIFQFVTMVGKKEKTSHIFQLPLLRAKTSNTL